MKIKEVISDGNIYYNIPCVNNCGIKWLLIDEKDNNQICSDCNQKETEDEKI